MLPGELRLRDGTPALIWPLLPTDAETLRDLFGRLSPESRRRRFLTALDDLDDTMIQRLVGDVDGVQHIALLLVVMPPDGLERVAGVARLLQYPADHNRRGRPELDDLHAAAAWSAWFVSRSESALGIYMADASGSR